MPRHSDPGIPSCGVRLLHQVAGLLDLTFQIGVRVRQDLQDIRPSTTTTFAQATCRTLCPTEPQRPMQLLVCGEAALHKAAGVSVDHDPCWHKDTPRTVSATHVFNGGVSQQAERRSTNSRPFGWPAFAAAKLSAPGAGSISYYCNAIGGVVANVC